MVRGEMPRQAGHLPHETHYATMNLRPAVPEDVGFFFYLAQDPAVRSASLSTGPIHWTEHVQWFQSQLDSGGFAFVGQMDGGEPVGSFRSDSLGVVSVAIAPRYRGKGLGKELISIGSEAASAVLGKELVAYIRPANEGSQGAFSGAGYRYVGTDTLRGVAVLRYDYRDAA